MCDARAIYGNVPAGEYRATLINLDDGRKFDRGPRLILGFAILEDDREEPICDPDGQPYFAVAVCNRVKGDNPKSKPFKIRRCLTSADEIPDPIHATYEAPPFDVLLGDLPNGQRRIVKVRVEQRPTSKGTFASEITHIQRLRDGRWEKIIGEWEGPSAPVANHG